MSVFQNHLESLEGQPIAILAARYWYRGILRQADESGILLSNPRAVEVTGSATASQPQNEDVIPSDLFIRTGFIECVCQPSWVFHEMDK